MLPEEKIAQRFLRDRKLTPPIDVRKVLMQIAQIEEVQIPGGADAILLGKNSKRSKPLILLQSSASPTRKVFTLGHELGHIMIPWHAGTFVCHTDFHIRVPGYIYLETEAEANRFSSEVLMPSDWIEALIQMGLTIPSILKTLQTTGVSALAASLALRRNLPPGFVFAEVTHSGEVRLAGKSKDTYVGEPVVGEQVGSAEIHTVAPQPDRIETPSGSIYWWHLKPIKRAALKTEIGDSREILNTILNDISDDACVRTKLMQSVNGVVGAANSKARHITVDVYTVLKGRFLGRPHLAQVTQHPLFENFLIRKSEELELR